VVPWVRAGVLAHRLSVVQRGDAGEESGPANGGAGLDLGVGIGTRRGVRVRPTLGLEYRGYRARVLGNEREGVSYVALGTGLSFAF